MLRRNFLGSMVGLIGAAAALSRTTAQVASGGAVKKDAPLVGERGPEVIMPANNGNVRIRVYVRDAQSFSRPEMATKIRDHLSRQMRRIS